MPTTTPENASDLYKSQITEIALPSPVDKTAAKALIPQDGVKIYPQGSDGGVFIGGTGKVAGYYNDNATSPSYGTKFKPTGGDGTAGWERSFEGGIKGSWFGLDNLQDAIDSMGTQPGTVLVDADFTVTDSVLHIRYSYQNLIDDGGSIAWAGTPAGHPFGVTGGLINVYPADYVYLVNMTSVIYGNKIKGLKLTGLGTEIVYTAGRQGIIFNGVRDFLCQKNRLEDFGAENILLDPAQDTTSSQGGYINNNHVIGGGNGFNSGNSEFWAVQNNIFEGHIFQGFEIPDGGVFSDNTIYNLTGGVLILGNALEVNKVDAPGTVVTANLIIETAGVIITSQSGSTPTNILFDGNTVVRSTDSGVRASAGVEPDTYIAITNNIITDNNINGIELISAAPGVHVSGNLVYPGPSGNQTTGINADVNSNAVIMNNNVSGHSTANINVGVNAVTGHNWTGERFESNSYYKAGGSFQGQSASLATDTAITIFADTDFSAAGSGMLLVNARASASVTGRNSLSLFMAHPSSIGHHTLIQSSGTGPGSAMVVSTAVLTGTTGAAGQITVSVSSTGSSWSAQVENRTGQAISLGWELMGYSR